MFAEVLSAARDSVLAPSLGGGVRRAPLRRLQRSALLAALFLAPAPLAAERPSNSRTSEHTRPEEHIEIQLTEQMVLSAEGVRSYSEGKRGIVDVRLTRSGDQFVLVGLRPGETSLLFIMEDGREQHHRIVVVDPNGTATEHGSQAVPSEDNVRLDFYFVQLSRSEHHQVGVGTPGSVQLGTAAASFDFLSQRFESATAVVTDQALLRLDMAQAAGWAKLMRQAAVITENGQRAEFSGGGEVNIVVQGSIATGIHSIEYGSTIEVLPRYDSASGRIQVQLRADVSDLADDGGTGAPGRVRSTLNTVVNLELGQAIVLAGLSSDSELMSRTGVPVLSQIPILGLLFGSQRKNHQASDNVVFIVPTVIEAASDSAKERIERALSSYRKYTGHDAGRKKLRQNWEAR